MVLLQKILLWLSFQDKISHYLKFLYRRKLLETKKVGIFLLIIILLFDNSMTDVSFYFHYQPPQRWRVLAESTAASKLEHFPQRFRAITNLVMMFCLTLPNWCALSYRVNTFVPKYTVFYFFLLMHQYISHCVKRNANNTWPKYWEHLTSKATVLTV